MKAARFFVLFVPLFSAIHSANAQQAPVAPSPVVVRSAARNAGLSELLWLLKNRAQKHGVTIEQVAHNHATILSRNVTTENVKALNFHIYMRLETEPVLGTQHRQSERTNEWGSAYYNAYKFAPTYEIPFDFPMDIAMVRTN